MHLSERIVFYYRRLVSGKRSAIGSSGSYSTIHLIFYLNSFPLFHLFTAASPILLSGRKPFSAILSISGIFSSTVFNSTIRFSTCRWKKSMQATPPPPPLFYGTIPTNPLSPIPVFCTVFPPPRRVVSLSQVLPLKDMGTMTSMNGAAT